MDECDPEIVIGNKSKSHRLINQEIKIHNPDNYFELMTDNRVLVNRIDRKEKILRIINQSSESLDLNPDLSEELLNELTDLVELPDLIIGKFSEEFLDIPVEVLSTVMKTHQRYIPLFQKDKTFSKLDLSSDEIISTNFFVISNGLSESNKNIAKGNEKVFKARFSDAKFFVESDKKISSNERNQKLKSVSYLKGMGNVFQRVARIEDVTKMVFKCLNDESLDINKLI